MNWLLIFAGFSALIILHEFGHFIVAKWTGMRVERFFLFFPPKLVSIKRGETEYGIGMIPLGGFVKITGMNPDEVEPRDPSDPPRQAGLLEKIESVDQEEASGVSKPGELLPPELQERAYYNQPVWKRIVVIAAGPVMNLLIAFAILFVLALSLQQPTKIVVGGIEDDSPAKGVLENGDRIVAVDGVEAPTVGPRPSGEELGDQANAIARQVNSHTCAGAAADGCTATTPATLLIERDGQKLTVTATPTYDSDAPAVEGDGEGRYRLGFAFDPADEVPSNLSAPEAAERAGAFMWDVTTTTVSIFARLFQEEQREQLSGVVGVSAVADETIDQSAERAWLLVAVVSLSLAIINLFPFLPLDGGHIFWSLVEKVRGKRVPFAVIERASAIGFLLVLCLFFIGLSNDIGRLTGEGFDTR